MHYPNQRKRYPVGKNVIQLPAGVIETDDIYQQAKKELFEETGIVADKWEILGSFYVAPGHETTIINDFIATKLNISNTKTVNQEDNEAIHEVIKATISEVKKLIASDGISCGLTLAALNLFLLSVIFENLLHC